VASIGSGAEYPWGSIKSWEKITHQAQDDHPDATSVADESKTTFQLGERVLTFEGIASFRSDQKYFYYTYTRRLWENGRLLREKTWEDTIPRDYH
jgi:hypothetical protein